MPQPRSTLAVHAESCGRGQKRKERDGIANCGIGGDSGEGLSLAMIGIRTHSVVGNQDSTDARAG